MKLSENLLRKLGEQRPTSPGREITHQDEASGWTVALTAEQADALSCRLRDLTVRPTNPGTPLDGKALRQKAEAIAEKVTGLMEPLRLVECDETRREAILRSDEPAQRGDTRSHYELRVDGQRKATLRRYQAEREPAAKRVQTPFTLTHEVLGHLVDDLAQVLS
jgi:hypothetical protein